MKTVTAEHGRQIILNRKAGHNYTIEDRYEAGIVLQGWEVKGILSGKAQLTDAYVAIRRSEVFLVKLHISLPAHTESSFPEPARERKLLMHRTEIRRLIGKVKQSGYTLIPLAINQRNNRLKLEFGLAKSKKRHDRRETVKKRDQEREIRRAVNRRSRS